MVLNLPLEGLFENLIKTAMERLDGKCAQGRSTASEPVGHPLMQDKVLALVTTSVGFNATPPLRFMCYLVSQGISLSIKFSNPDTNHVSRLLTSVSQGLRRSGRSFIYFRDTRIYTTK